MTIPKITMSVDTIKELFAKQITQSQHIMVSPNMLEIRAVINDPNDNDSYKVISFDELQIKVDMPHEEVQ